MNYRPISIAIVLLASLFVGAHSATKPHVDSIGDHFSKFQYRPNVMSRYVTHTAAWKEGRRKILDYGSGAGGLALSLAKQGADHVVAVDLNTNARAAAQDNLEPFQNAVARGPQFTLFGLGTPGKLGYTSKFDIILSFCGALSYGTTTAKRIPMEKALSQAVKACHEGGSVIVGQQIKSKGYRTVLSLALAIIIGWNVKANWLWNVPFWQEYCFWQLICGETEFGVAFSVKNIARSIMLRSWRVSSIFHGVSLASSIWIHFKNVSLYISAFKKAMEDSGLTDVKHCHRFSFPAVMPIKGFKAPFRSHAISVLQNIPKFPAMVLLIFEGVKKRN